MSDLSRIRVGGWEYDITCDDCYGSLEGGSLADIVEQAERHMAEHGPKMEDYKRRQEEARHRNAEAKAEWAKEHGREPTFWEWARICDERLNKAVWEKLYEDLPSMLRNLGMK